MPKNIRKPPRIRLIPFSYLRKAFLTFCCVRNIETIVNQVKAVRIMIAEIVRMIYNGVELLITKVNKLRKNNVAFGFNTFVRKPVLKACKRVKSVSFLVSERSTFEFFVRKDPIPI